MRDVIIILGVMGISFGALTLTSTIVPQLIGIGVLVVARPLFYTAISDYAAKVFGYVPIPSLLLVSLLHPFIYPFFYILLYVPSLRSREKIDARFETFGTVYGLAMTLSGLLGLLLTPMDLLTKNALGGNFTPINVILLVLGAISAMGLYWRVWSHVREGTIRVEDGGGVEWEAGYSGISQVIVEENEDEE
jgi:hypothetical protein